MASGRAQEGNNALHQAIDLGGCSLGHSLSWIGVEHSVSVILHQHANLKANCSPQVFDLFLMSVSNFDGFLFSSSVLVSTITALRVFEQVSEN